MYVEPSAIVGILLEEPEAADLREKLAVARNPVISVVGKVEAALSVGQKIQDYELGRLSVGQFCEDAGITVLPVPVEMYDEMLKAYQRYGKGTGHAARLNFGDCFSYAFARQQDDTLLFKGSDFSRTDIKPA